MPQSTWQPSSHPITHMARIHAAFRGGGEKGLRAQTCHQMSSAAHNMWYSDEMWIKKKKYFVRGHNHWSEQRGLWHRLSGTRCCVARWFGSRRYETTALSHNVGNETASDTASCPRRIFNPHRCNPLQTHNILRITNYVTEYHHKKFSTSDKLLSAVSLQTGCDVPDYMSLTHSECVCG